MAEGKTSPTYDYVTLAMIPRGEGERPTYVMLGIYPARDPAEAIEAAVADGGLPAQDGGRVVAVTTAKWHVRDVTIEHVPAVRLAPVSDDEGVAGQVGLPIGDPPGGEVEPGA